MFVITGILTALAGLAGYLFPAIRNAEDILPDHDFQVEEAPRQSQEIPQGAEAQAR